MTGIEKRRLGSTGLEVTGVSLGGVFISETATEHGEAIRVVHRALELGVNYIDTAPFYGNSQVVLGEALEGRTESYVLGSKCGRWDWDTGPYRDLDAFKAQFEQTLKDLRHDSVDVLYIHEADWQAYWQNESPPRKMRNISIEDQYDFENAPVTAFLHWAKDQGLAKHLGVSGNNAHLLAKVLKESAIPIEVVLVAFQYSLIWRNAGAHLLPLTRELGVGVALGAPLQQGVLAFPRPEWIEDPPGWMDDDLLPRFKALYDIHRETGLSLPELAIRFLLADDDVTTIPVGAATVEQLEQNVGCMASGPLPQDIHKRLQAIGKVFERIE